MGSFDVSAQANPNLTTVKNVDLNYAAVGSTLNYTIVLKNNGDAIANNIIVTDLIPQGANFVLNSVILDGVTKTGVDPALGIDVGTIPIGSTSTITLKALVVTVPWSADLVNFSQTDYQFDDLTTIVNISIDSNSVITTINSPIMNLSKSSNTTIITGPGQVITYVLTLRNTGTTTGTNVTFIDTIPTGTTFVANSIQVLGNTIPGTIAPPSGLNIGALPNGFFTTLSFKVTVVSIPSSNSISNFCDVTYGYTVDPITPINATGRGTSNLLEIFTSNLRANLVGITKWANKKFATINDLITYVITIPNSGNTTAINVVIVDTVPSGTSYVAGSLFVNGSASGDLPSAINIGTIGPGSLSTLEFKVKVN